jgi:hypothetical protein
MRMTLLVFVLVSALFADERTYGSVRLNTVVNMLQQDTTLPFAETYTKGSIT